MLAMPGTDSRVAALRSPKKTKEVIFRFLIKSSRSPPMALCRESAKNSLCDPKAS